MKSPDLSLQLENVSFAYRDKTVLGDLTMSLGDGEMIGIVGPNGSGKSTMLKIMSGMIRPRVGTVRLFNKALRDYKRREVARYIAFVPQEMPAAFGYSAGDFVLMGRRPYHGALPFETVDDEKLARRAMIDTDTDALAERSLTELSGGERQRVVIAAALAQQPSIMLLDEPTASLDLRYQIQIHAILKRLNQNNSITVAVVTHDLNMAALFFPRVVVLSEGRIIADGHPWEVLTPQLVKDVYRVHVDFTTRPGGAPIIVPGIRAPGDALAEAAAKDLKRDDPTRGAT
jgi:cobalamin transport system ATP-binding protein